MKSPLAYAHLNVENLQNPPTQRCPASPHRISPLCLPLQPIRFHLLSRADIVINYRNQLTL